jgi:uncharacterized protein YjbJ (UPF0337 family)
MRFLIKALFLSLVAVVTLVGSLLIQAPVMALSLHPSLPAPLLGATSSQFDAAAKDAEGKLQVAAGTMTGDNGQKARGETKRLQAEAMKVDADVMDVVKRDAQRVEDATS